MKVNRQFIFWVVTLLFLVMLFSSSLGGWDVALFFVTFLFPVILSTSLFFNQWLIPRYLLNGKRALFALYFIYMLIVSIYLELLVMVLAFVILADYQIDNLGKIAGDIYLLAVILYLIVFINGFMEVFERLKQKNTLLQEIALKKENERKGFLMFRVDRKNVRVKLEDILFIESLSDYVKVHTPGGIHTTKEKIGALEQALPDHFLRVHRSFIVNTHHISSFTKEQIMIDSSSISIGRKYKEHVINSLEASITSDNTIPHSS